MTDQKIAAVPTINTVTTWWFWTVVFCVLWILIGDLLRPVFGAEGSSSLDDRLLPMFLFILVCYPAYRLGSILLSSPQAYEAAGKQQTFPIHSKTIIRLTRLLCLLLMGYVFYVVSCIDYPIPDDSSLPAAAAPLKSGESAIEQPAQRWTLLQYIQFVSVPVSLFLIVLLEMFQRMLPKAARE